MEYIPEHYLREDDDNNHRKTADKQPFSSLSIYLKIFCILLSLSVITTSPHSHSNYPYPQQGIWSNMSIFRSHQDSLCSFMTAVCFSAPVSSTSFCRGGRKTISLQRIDSAYSFNGLTVLIVLQNLQRFSLSLMYPLYDYGFTTLCGFPPSKMALIFSAA